MARRTAIESRCRPARRPSRRGPTRFDVRTADATAPHCSDRSSRVALLRDVAASSCLDHRRIDTQGSHVGASPCLDQRSGVTQSGGVETSSSGDGRPPREAQRAGVVASTLVPQLVLLCRIRNGIQQSLLAFDNQIAAKERMRTGESKDERKKRTPTLDDIAAANAILAAMEEPRKPLVKSLRDYDKQLTALAKDLPVFPFVESVRGFGALGLALIIGATGDLSNYANPGKVWKRMGLAVMPDGRQRRVADKELAIAHGYNPRRRSLMHVIGDSLIKQNGRAGDGYYRKVYDDRKVYAETAHPEWTKAHRHMDALRYMEKRLLRHLWQAWNRATNSGVAPLTALSPYDFDAEACVAMLPTSDVPRHQLLSV